MAGESAPSGVLGVWQGLFYAALFAAFAQLMRINWQDLSPVNRTTLVDARALQLQLLHDDAPGARVAASLDQNGIHLSATNLRRNGAQLLIESPLVELDCPLLTAHVHPPPRELEQVMVAVDARSSTAGTALRAAIGLPTSSRLVHQLRISAAVPLGPAWQTLRLPLDSFTPDAPTVARSGLIASLLFRFEPPTQLDVSLKNPRLVRVPRAAEPGAPAPPSLLYEMR
jgi:hypothetical protein